MKFFIYISVNDISIGVCVQGSNVTFCYGVFAVTFVTFKGLGYKQMYLHIYIIYT